jgi:hypothetical protein
VDRSGKIPSKKWKKDRAIRSIVGDIPSLLLADPTVIPDTARDKDRACNVSPGIRLMISIAMALLGCLAFDSVFVYWQTVGRVYQNSRRARGWHSC